MTDRKVMSLVIKVLGFWCIITAIPFISRFFYGMLATKELGIPTEGWLERSMLWLSILGPVVLLIILAILFLRLSDRMAQRLYPSEESLDFGETGPQIGWYHLVLSIIGAVLLVRMIPQDLSRLVILLRSERYVGGQHLAFFIRFGLTVAIGLYLVFGSKGLARFLHKIRTAPEIREESGNPE